jgi:DNA-binding FadR family transcriptional regulator
MYPRSVRALQADALFLSALQRPPGDRSRPDAVISCHGGDELIRVAGLATRVACQRMTPRYLKALSDSIEQVCCVPATFAWDRKATAYAEIVNLLADAAADPVLALLARNLPGHLYDLIVTVGPAADDIIAGSHRRLLALIRARDADGAGREMEQHLEGLSWTVRRREHEPHAPGQSERVPDDLQMP